MLTAWRLRLLCSIVVTIPNGNSMPGGDAHDTSKCCAWCMQGWGCLLTAQRLSWRKLTDYATLLLYTQTATACMNVTHMMHYLHLELTHALWTQSWCCMLTAQRLFLQRPRLLCRSRPGSPAPRAVRAAPKKPLPRSVLQSLLSLTTCNQKPYYD